jgi:hypothetical protein
MMKPAATTAISPTMDSIVMTSLFMLTPALEHGYLRFSGYLIFSDDFAVRGTILK